MEPIELRLGNLVYDNYRKVISTVIEIRKTGIIYTDQGKLSLGEYQPIPLTQDDLVKYGFAVEKEDTREYDERIWYNRFSIHQGISSNEFAFCVYVRSNGYMKSGYTINYIHELQNLFHSITRKELLNEA